MLIVARIHNNKLGRVVEVLSEEDGKDLIRDMVSDQFGRDLNTVEEDHLENDLEFHDDSDSDPDNHYTFSIGIVEDE